MLFSAAKVAPFSLVASQHAILYLRARAQHATLHTIQSASCGLQYSEYLVASGIDSAHSEATQSGGR